MTRRNESGLLIVMDRRIDVSLFLAFALFFWIALVPASEAAPNPKLKRAIENVIGGKRDLDVGIIVMSMDTGEIYYEKNPDTLMIPASVNKVFTAFTAMKKLRPASTFKTYIFATGPIHDGKLAGDLYIKGTGDPSLVSERMWMLTNDLLRSGIKTITGNLVGDASYYDSEKTPESRPKYLKDQAYNAPIGALSFNFNTTTVYVKPADSAGEQPIVYTDPANSYIEVVNQAMTGKAGGSNTISVNRTDFVKGDIGDTVLLRGSIPLDHKEMRFYKNIVNPALYTTHMFQNFLEQRGIKVQGNILEGKVPASARQLLEFESLPVWQIIWGMNKFSNNFVADQITKKVGAEAWGEPGTMQKGVSALQDVLEDIGIPRKSYQISDGSGLTRNTRVTARQILQVLRAAYKDLSLGPEFMASLGIAGEDGTLRHRFSASTSSAPSFFLRAKTGTLDGVSALAGYSVSPDKENLAFAILLNDPKLKYGKMTAWVDQIAAAITKNSKKTL
jgi:serine-type D-Ala-D-Ala carboxypeptidase/endopeptidase (penicillin-binding protein 4)